METHIKLVPKAWIVSVHFEQKMSSTKNYLTLSNGAKMPLVGLGTWQTNNEEQARIAIESAIKAGYRLIDTAAIYLNEALIGEVLEKLFKNGTVKREDMFITTKIWITYLQPDRQEKSLRESLGRLRLEYVDLVLAHMPTAMKEDGMNDTSTTVEDIWRGFESLYNKGLAKSIGVSNWSVEQMERVLNSGKVPIHCTQNEIHVYFPQIKLINFCRKNNIAQTSYGSIGSPARQKTEGTKHFSDSPNMMEEQLIVDLSKKYKKTPAQILLKYLVQRKIAVIPKSSNPERIAQNIDLFNFNLEQSELEDLNHVKHRQILFVQEFMLGHPEDGLVEHRNGHQRRRSNSRPRK